MDLILYNDYIYNIPAFSANVYGITSSASANALTHIDLAPVIVYANYVNLSDKCISGAPPPGIRPLLFTKLLTTHKASCILRSASSNTN